jgi:hypothetical protein
MFPIAHITGYAHSKALHTNYQFTSTLLPMRIWHGLLCVRKHFFSVILLFVALDDPIHSSVPHFGKPLDRLSHFSLPQCNMRMPPYRTTCCGQKSGLLKSVSFRDSFFISLFSRYLLGYLLHKGALSGFMGIRKYTSH